MNKKKKLVSAVVGVALLATLGACGSSKSSSSSSKDSGKYFDKGTSTKAILTKAQKENKIGNAGGGNQYELLALLSKYGLKQKFVSQGFDMSSFDNDSILIATGTTYNDVGLVKNSYEGAYNYGDSVGLIDMNKEGVAMLEDNLFTTKEYAEKNPNTTKAFVYASLQGWEYACEHPDEAAKIVQKAGSTLSDDHQKYEAKEVKKLVEHDTDNKKVDNIGEMKDSAMQNTLDLAKKYVTLDDSAAAAKLKDMTLDDIRDTSYYTAAENKDFGTPEDKNVTIQMKWLTQAQFMGYYVAESKGYYDKVGLDVTLTPGGGDVSETTAVNNGTADFGVTWVTNLAASNAGGMDLLEVAQLYQRSGMQLIYKYNE